MAKKDDIPDALFDDDLQHTIEKADLEGEWRDTAAAFVDPKLEEIKKQLVEPARQNYNERRMRDLQRRAQAGARSTTALPPEPDSAPSTEVWQEAVVPASEPTASQPLAPPLAPAIEFVRSRGNRSPLATYVRSIVSGLLVFAVVSAVYAALTGWRSDIVVRALSGGSIAGIGWCLLQAGRFRAAIIGVVTHVLVFSISTRVGQAMEMLAIFCGALVALLGSVVVGMAREANGEDGSIRG